MKVINFFAGPGAGKSTLASALFSELKFAGLNVEYATEYAKDKTWQGDHFSLGIQEYLFAKQNYRLRRLRDKVEFVITDAPLLLSNIYMPDDYDLPSLRKVVWEAWDTYDNINFYVKRKKQYNPSGRNQTENEAKNIDTKVKSFLDNMHVDYYKVNGDRTAIPFILGAIAQ